MGMPRLAGTSEKVTEAVAAFVRSEKVKVPAPSWPTCGTFWLMVVLPVGKKAEKVLPGTLKLTVMGLVAKRVTVTVAGLAVRTV